MVARDLHARLGARPAGGAIDPLSAAEAARRIQADIHRQPPLRIPLDDAAGSVLAESVISPIDIPVHPNSAMDGYAVRGEDVRGAGPESLRTLEVVEQIPASHFPVHRLEPGQASRIFTGAPLPPGADTVIRQEDTDLGRERVAIRSDRDLGSNIRQAGEDIRQGALLLEDGALLGPAELGALASVAVSHPVVYRRPRVAILASGDEIVDLDQPDEILSGRKVASSNSHTLIALVREAGGVPVSLGIAADTPASVREHLLRAADCDLLVTTAGISVGEHDYLRGAIEEAGEIRFWRLRMRPGAPVGFGVVRGVPWVGLPGNPVSTMVTFELFVRPAIRTMMGHRLPFRRTVRVRAAETVRVNPKLQHFLRAVVDEEPGGLVARLTGPQGSGILTSMIRANALLIVPEGQPETAEGAELPALLLADPRHQAEPPF